MKAALLHQLGENPTLGTAPEPVKSAENQEIISVKAVAIKNLDKARAAGKHYANYQNFPAVLGMDAVGTLPDGTLVYASGLTGTLAEKAIIDSNLAIKIPENTDIAKAAALPNAVMGAALALKFRAQIKRGDTVMINGATGVTGKIAVQLAKIYGAKTVIAAGRNEEILANLQNTGADIIIDLKKEDEEIIGELSKIFNENPPDIIIDYLWGKTAENILQALPKGGIGKYPKPVKIVTVGEMSGAKISVTSGQLRSTDITILGSGFGSLSPEQMHEFHREILPQMFSFLAEGKISIDTETRPLEEVAEAWSEKISAGKRLVITI